MAVSDRFLALGTHWGVVHILDLIGTDVKRFNCHAATVNALSIDTAGEFVASASDDGKVIINSLYTSEVLPFNYKRPVKAVCLEPDYSKKSTRQFVSGGMAEFLLMSGKGWFGTKDVVISSGEGPIYAVQWRGNFIAWANEAGVKIYDVSTQQKFAYVDRPPNSPRADLYRCNLVWKSDVDLMIGWADSVKLCTVKERSKMDIASGLPSRYVEITCQFRTDFIVCGIAPLADEIVLLSYLTDLPDSKNVDMVPETPMKRVRAKPPEIHIVTATGEAVGNDVLSLLGFEHYRANDYRLEYLPSDKKSDHTFYVVSPKDIVVAKPRDLEDHIEWLVERKKYEAALKAADEAGPAYEGRLQVNSIVEIGKLYLKELVDSGRFEDAAAIMPKILRDNAALWEEWVHIFHDKGQLMILYPCIPTSEPRLDPGVYMIVLLHLLETNPDLLLTTLQEWSPELYHVSELAERVERIRNKSTLIQEICMLLHTWDKHFDRALYYALILHLPTALELVARHNLYTWVQDHAVLIMDYDDWFVHHDPDVKTQIEKAVAEENATLMNTPLLGPGLGYVGGDIEVARARAAVDRSGVQILVGFPDRIMQSRVIQQLQSHRRYLHIFLDALFKQDAQLGEQYHPAQVELYAEFDYPRLIDFLRLSPAYNVGIAYEICQKRDLVPEMVFLLGKMGDNRRALMLIIERLGDVKRAIEFAKDQNDEELWEDLLHYAMDKPAFIVGMLENLSSYINPIRLVERIPNGLQIEGLKSALLKILGDCSIHMSLREGCEKILVSDTIELLETLYRAQRRALVFQDDVICSMCNIQIEQEADAPDAHLVVFFCRHTFHEECVSSTGGTPIKGGAISEKGKNPKSVIRAGPLQAGIPSESDLSPELEASTRRIYQRPALFYTSMNGIGLGGTGGVIPTVTLDRFGARVITLGSSSRPRRPKPVGLVCPICRSSKIKHHHGRRMSTDVANTTKDLAISENPLITATASSSPLPKPIVSTSSRLRHILTHA
ncbi:hypothetical protein DFS34DRAFT_619093 [Phlyctochytrium arcticum]|nr:hypothetical protein DFS34DRAFT_619093 [Phlyctochytrium arcticum]